MTDVVKNDNIASVVSAIETLVRDSTDKIAETATKYGPQVLDTAESYVRVLSAIALVKGALLVIIAIPTLYYLIKNIKNCYNKMDHNEDYIIPLVALCVGLVVGTIMVFHFLADTFTTDNILGVISPKLELIKMSKDALTTHLVGK